MDQKDSAYKCVLCGGGGCRARSECCSQLPYSGLPSITSSVFIVGQPGSQTDETAKSSNGVEQHSEENNSPHIGTLVGASGAQFMLRQLETLFQHHDVDTLSQAHSMFLTVYVTALETGFIPHKVFTEQREKIFLLEPWTTFHQGNVDFCCTQPLTYEYDTPHETYFTEKFHISTAAEGREDALKSVLTALITGDFMMITLTPDPSTQLIGRSVCLSICRYVIAHPKTQCTAERCYQKLDKLSVQLRNEVFVPVRNDQLTFVGAFPQPTFMGMPPEVRLRIYDCLKKTELAKLGLVNKVIFDEINNR